MPLVSRYKLNLSVFELAYGRPITKALEKGHLSSLEMKPLQYVLQVEEYMKALMKYGNQVCLHPLT